MTSFRVSGMRIARVATAIPRVNVASPRTAGLRDLTEALYRLQSVCEAGNAAEAVAIVKSLAPEFRHAGQEAQPAAVLEPVTI